MAAKMVHWLVGRLVGLMEDSKVELMVGKMEM